MGVHAWVCSMYVGGIEYMFFCLCVFSLMYLRSNVVELTFSILSFTRRYISVSFCIH